MEVHTPNGRFHLLIRLDRVELHRYHQQQITMVPYQIIVYIILAGKKGWFGIKLHPHSSSRGGSLSLLISDNLLFSTRHFRDMIQIRPNNGESRVAKLETERYNDLIKFRG